MAARAQALIFDFNGTLSDDEALLVDIYADITTRAGRTLDERTYRARFAGNADEHVFSRWLGLDADGPVVAELTARRIAAYTARVRDGATVRPAVREAVLLAAARVPVALATGAVRAEVDPVLAAAGLAEALAVRVTADDVARHKPDPETYERAVAALELRSGRTFDRAAVVAIEDTAAGIRSARAAGLSCIAVGGTQPLHVLVAAGAQRVVPAITPALVAELVGGAPQGEAPPAGC